MDNRTGSITVTALVGTGLATLAVSLTGVAGLSGDLQAAAVKQRQAIPSLTPGEEVHETNRLHSGYVLRDACDKKKRRAPGTTPGATTPSTTPAPTASAREF